MRYIVNLYSNNRVISECKFHSQQEAFIHIGRVITNAANPIIVEVEILQRYFIKDGVSRATTLVYHLREVSKVEVHVISVEL